MVNSERLNAVKNMKEYAKEKNVPIMSDAGINYITTFIIKYDIKEILEIGSAIGYSSIMLALTRDDVKITTVERDEQRYLEALKNIKKFHLEDRINIIFRDALDLKLDEKYEMIFIDAAKGQNINFFKRFEKNLNDKGVIITDNMFFHGYVNKDESEIKSRNLRGLVRKIKDYHKFLLNNKDYHTEILPIGDGIAVSYKN